MDDLSPVDWAILPLKRYATFSGRSSRAEFWWFFLFTMLLYILAMFVIGIAAGIGGLVATNPASALVTGAIGLPMIVIMLFWLALFIPTLAVQVRRLHDTNRSGWWIGAFWLVYVVYLLVTSAMGLGAPQEGTPSISLAVGALIVGLVFFVYSIVLLVFFCLRGTPGPNRFGEDPYAGSVGAAIA